MSPILHPNRRIVQNSVLPRYGPPAITYKRLTDLLDDGLELISIQASKLETFNKTICCMHLKPPRSTVEFMNKCENVWV